jgi:hypothetical protein
MNNFSLQDLRDILSAVEADKLGTHGDERSIRLDKLDIRLRLLINRAKREEGK